MHLHPYARTTIPDPSADECSDIVLLNYECGAIGIQQQDDAVFISREQLRALLRMIGDPL